MIPTLKPYGCDIMSGMYPEPALFMHSLNSRVSTCKRRRIFVAGFERVLRTRSRLTLSGGLKAAVEARKADYV
jgi:hypothetical protein